ncbi:MAG: hypothetical protein HN712_02645 [Gemmatimonadetes bacterium]|nr:hypothetical protein [Gemmatimonadota bacterium]MBT7859175.1 hypothetical protein [Gemmatimonadota bacterium]
MTGQTAHDLLYRHFDTPPTHFGPIPFWFWNDHLEEAELLRQLHAFHGAGCGGVIPHARIGLSPEIGYLSDTFLHLMRRVVEEAASLGMKIILYDEASYPSGSARGAVAAENPDYVSQAIGLWQKEIEGPKAGFWRPPVGRALRDRHVLSCAGRLLDGQVDPQSVICLEPRDHDVLPYDLGGGDWFLMSVWNTDSGGHIRGAYPYEESGSALAPAAGDILNPDAVGAFLRLTHDRYAEVLGDHFGKTIIGLFTDEPSIFGKGAKRPAQPHAFSPGLLPWLQEHFDRTSAGAEAGERFDLGCWLPALWVGYGARTDEFRTSYTQAIQERLHEVFYEAQSSWCQRHGLALTGHPGASNDTASLERFHLPGQDMVWRWVLPGAPTALVGDHAAAPKAATAAARRRGSRRCLTEVCGAYGWHLTLAETKWLFDWHLVRGNNLINPHAFFYSIAGRRAYESEPDLGIHNVWWPSVGHVLRYAGRISWLLADAQSLSETAIIGLGGDLPWRAAAALLQGQHDFDYLTPADLARGRPRDGQWIVGGGARFRRLVIDLPQEDRPPDLPAALTRARQAGISVIDGWSTDEELLAQVGTPDSDTPRWSPASTDIRLRHVRKAGLDVLLLVNEGLSSVSGDLWVPVLGVVEAWDALRGQRRELNLRPDARGQWIQDLQLPPFESIVLIIDPWRPQDTAAPVVAAPDSKWPLQADWVITDRSGNRVDVVAQVDWARQPGWELFSGTLIYHAHIELDEPASGLDLGHVGDLAEVYLDGQNVGAALWPPYVVRTEISPGSHELAVHVTNSMANEYEGTQNPSGLMGPVSLLSSE